MAEKLPGGMNNYAATIPAGKVGVWAGSGTQSVKADDFKMLDMGMPKDVDGRWYDTVGSTSLAGGKISLAAVTGGASGSGAERTVLRRGFRGGKYVFEYDHDLITSETTGVVLHYQDAENFMAFGLEHVTGTTMKPRLMRRKDGEFASLATGSNFTITSGDRVRVAIKDDPGNSALQKLEVYVAGTSRFTSTAIDDDWSAGLAGFYVRSGQTSTVTFDNCKIGYDNNADDDCDDAGDDVQIDDDFASNVVNLAYDNNGNMTDDGILKYVYDAWNRLAKAKRRVDAETVIGTYAYDGATRRTKKVVTNQGAESVAADGGNSTEDSYYCDEQIGGRSAQAAHGTPWSVVETRDGSNATCRSYAWGVRYVDELVWIEINGDSTIGNDTNPDLTATGEGSESPGDARLFSHQPTGWSEAALTSYDATGFSSGGIHTRQAPAPYAVGALLDDSNGASTALMSTSMEIGGFNGLIQDLELGMSWCNRTRRYFGDTSRYSSRDALFSFDAPSLAGKVFIDKDEAEWREQLEQNRRNLYAYRLGRPFSTTDPYGTWGCCGNCSSPAGPAGVPPAMPNVAIPAPPTAPAAGTPCTSLYAIAWQRYGTRPCGWWCASTQSCGCYVQCKPNQIGVLQWAHVCFMTATPSCSGGSP